ncbi:MAG: prephenate dehydratase [Planctomycetia bacterium]|nr:prephenate dehydratase [Planctomycetia bacterium]
MAKAPKKKPAAASAKNDPGKLATEIQRVDRELIKLANERARLSGQVIKAGGPTHSDLSEIDYHNLVSVHNQGPLADRAVASMFRELLSGIDACHQRQRVAYLGPMYSYTHLAALEKFGHSADLVPVGNIVAVFEEVNRGHAKYGVVPIENSTDGRITDTLDTFTRLPMKICGEVALPIHHNLLGKCPRSDVTEVYSKPQAISQCRNWLAKHLPQARPIEVTSTSAAAQLAREKPGAAAIASLEAGVHYGLEVLAESIEDNPANQTRFAVIGQHSGPRTGNDKTALMCDLQHRPGSLADALQIFKKHKLNLTWIESFPFPAEPGRYFFFLELLGHETDPAVRKAIAELEPQSRRLVVLGAYPRATARE